ncbi:putative serine/threonine protein kinase [Chlamydiales bacterium STE3]|nr:putative serine/threonine protein kinase [Chlamydiales bacterium STE3]
MNEEDFFKRSTIPPLSPGELFPDRPEPIPSKIGPYSIETLLDKGGMSILYLGTHPERQDPITIKVLLPKFLSHPEMTSRFLNEAEIIALADHPNIVKLFGYGEWEGGLYIAMEFIQGVSLRQYLLQNPLSLKRSLEITLEIAYALCHLHTHGVIHRDLKPDNILINEDGRVKVIDFGIAQLLDPQEKAQEGSAGRRLIGTPIYMSPEQRENPENVSYPSDIYSLGIITYELALGKLSHGQIHLSLMPKGLQKVLAKALQPAVQDRYQDIVDFISDLSSYLHSSNLEKERKASDQVGEIFERLQETQFKITRKDPPKWEEMEIGLTQHRPFGISSIYCDFFELPNREYVLIMAESSQNGAEGLMYISYFKGLAKALFLHNRPINEFASLLNQHIISEKIEETFAFSLLILQPESNQLSYLSCGYGPLWILPHEDKRPHCLKTENITLGLEKSFHFESLVHKWLPQDILIVCPSALLEPTFPQDQFENFLLEISAQSPQKQTEAIFRKAKNNNPKYIDEHPCLILSLHRESESS